MAPQRKRNFENENRKQKKIEFSYPKGNFPRLVLLGNSNVGKSSLTKLLLTSPKFYIGKIGKTPGSTIKLNLINDPSYNFQIIDLPGFGKMIRLKNKQEIRVQEQIIDYLKFDAPNIFLCLLVVNVERLEDELEKFYFKKKDTIPLTIEFLLYILDNGIPCVMVLNKVDKINSYDIKRIEEKLEQVFYDFDVFPENIPENMFKEMLYCSTKTKEGVGDLKKIINKFASKIDLNNYDPKQELHKLKRADELYKERLKKEEEKE